MEAAEAGGSNVVPVEVVHDVDQDEQGAAGVEFALEGFLHDGAPFGGHGMGW